MSRTPFFLITFIFAALGATLGILGSTSALLRIIPRAPAATEDVSLRKPVAQETAADIAAIKDNLLYLYRSPWRAGSRPGFFVSGEVKGIGVPLTSDGLFMTSLAPQEMRLATYLKNPSSFLRVTLLSGYKDSFDKESGLTFFTAHQESAAYRQFRPAVFAAYDTLRLGDEVVAVEGNRVRFYRIAALGSAQDPAHPLASEDATHFAVSLDTAPAAGLPLFTRDGKLLGFSMKDGGVYLAELLQQALASYFSKGKFTRTYLGVQGLDTNSMARGAEESPQGFFVTGVTPGSPAVQAGVKGSDAVHDLILSFDGQRLNGAIPLPVLLQRYPSGAEVTLKVMHQYAHDEGEETVKVVLGSK